jgi:hypothetical protein
MVNEFENECRVRKNGCRCRCRCRWICEVAYRGNGREDGVLLLEKAIPFAVTFPRRKQEWGLKPRTSCFQYPVT